MSVVVRPRDRPPRIVFSKITHLCEKNDWISVPAGTKHWFDMGPKPAFCASRFFDNPDGWVAAFTGDPIASRYPLLDELMDGR